MRLYLDDVRPTPDGFNLRAFTAKDAIGLLQIYPITFISFDHDLGPESAGTGYDVAEWIEHQAFTQPDFTVPQYAIHSANPVGVRNIDGAMKSAIAERRRREDRRENDRHPPVPL